MRRIVKDSGEKNLQAMRYVLIDKIIELEPGQKLKGVKNVTFSDGLARPFGADWTTLPAAFLLEAMAQAAGLLVAATIECRAQPVLAKVQQMQILGRAAAGDQIEIYACLNDLNEAGAKVSVNACVNDALLAKGIVFLSLVSFADLGENAGYKHRRNLQARLASLFPNWFQSSSKAETVL